MINVFFKIFKSRGNVKSFFNKSKYLLNFDCSQSSLKRLSREFAVSQQHRANDTSKFERQMPSLVYIQNPITWLINKIDFKMLKSAWDSEFDEKEFKRGTIQAVSMICTLISKNLWDNLRGLVSRQALIRLQRDVEVNWSDEQRRNISIVPEDVKLALSRKVHFLKIADQKFVDVDMMFVAMKFRDIDPSLGNDLVLIELVARFHRNYTTGELPNWTVTLFKVTRFNSTVTTR